ncbi:MAG: N-acyl-D-amino-acid deacylase family protein [Candidatus Kariarchaeaceae archaeon]|jgi:N-acyl-D-amino-acid deacylase
MTALGPDFILRGGTVYDGSGSPPQVVDIAILGDRVVKIAPHITGYAGRVIEAAGLAVAPGFINMLSWSVESLIEDGRALSTITQGVTLEVMGEGWSWGPLSEQMKEEFPKIFTSPIEYDIEWDTLGEYLHHLQNRGISTNVASFVGATTLRMNAMGHENRPPTDEEMEQMRQEAHVAMQEGALGIGTSLIYPPAFYADTQELIELCKVAAHYGGMYITHMRSEGAKFLEAIDEVLTISREANIAAEIYHLKAAGRSNWHKLEAAIEKIEQARAEGLQITTDMYLYPRAGTGLDSCLPPSIHEGGRDAFLFRLRDPEIRKQMVEIMDKPTDEWENLYYEAGPDNIWPSSFDKEHNKKYIGKSITEIAQEEGKDPRDVVIDLLIDDESRIGTVYGIMNEENVRKKIKLPYMSFGSDGSSMAPEGVFLDGSTHPRAYGNFARLLGKYVREEKIIPLEEAIYKLTKLPATNLKLPNRGEIKEGHYADIAIFDPDEIADRATYEEPHQLSVGMKYVFVNGELVLDEGKHTGATPGMFIQGPGYKI